MLGQRGCGCRLALPQPFVPRRGEQQAHSLAALLQRVECPQAFYPAQAMGMNIKDPRVHAMARELAARRRTSVTDAVRQALRAELDRSAAMLPGQEDMTRQEALLQLRNRCRQLPWPDGLSGAELQAELYDEAGLPL